MYWDKNGKEIDLMTWGKLFDDIKYKVIKQDELPNGKRVSTVWIGTNLIFYIIKSVGEEKRLIFETMVFEEKTWLNIDENRYATLNQAIRGHNKMVKKHIGSEKEYQLYKLKE